MSRVPGGGRALLGLAMLGACSYPSFYLGVVPVPGRTGVDPEVEVRVELGEIRPDAPALAETFELRGPSGPVPLSARYDGRFLTLTPDGPLAEGDYLLDGSPEHPYRGARGHYSRGFLSAPGLRTARTRFQVGGRPRVIGHVAWREGERLVIFSEPVQLDSAVGRVLVDGETVDLAITDEPRMLAFPVETPLIVDTGLSSSEAPQVRVLAGVTSVRGPGFEPGLAEEMQDCELELQLGQGSECY